MLYTNLKHLENLQEHACAIHENEHVIVTCGRMEYGCITVFRMMEELEAIYPAVRFYDMEFDNPESAVIRFLPQLSDSSALPIIVCYKNAEVVYTCSGALPREAIIRLLDAQFMNPIDRKENLYSN